MSTRLFTLRSEKGFTLLELVVVLGISGLIFAGLWGLLGSGSAQLQAQTAAQQYRKVLDATHRLLAAGVPMGGAGGACGTAPPFDPNTCVLDTPTELGLSVLTDTNIGLLSASFASGSGNNYTDAFGHAIHVKIEKLDNTNQRWRFMVYSTTPSGIPAISDKAGAQLSSLIGAEGGFVYSQPTEGCSTSANASHMACGSFNSFAFDMSSATAPSVAAYNTSVVAGDVAALAFTNDNTTIGAPWLMRFPDLTGVGFNTMQSDMDFKAPDAAAGVGPFTLRMKGNNLNMGDQDADTIGGGAFNVNGGEFNMRGGAINMNGPSGASLTSGGGPLNMANGIINDIGPTVTGANTTMTFNDLVVKATSGNITLITNSGTSINWPLLGGDPKRTDINSTLLDIVGTGRAETFQAAQFIYNAGGAVSDRGLKFDVRPIPNALSKVLRLQGVNYDWRGSERKDIGLVAQDVQKVFPEVVVDVGHGQLGVDYAKLVGPLVEAIRELKQENDSLKKRVDALQGQTQAP